MDWKYHLKTRSEYKMSYEVHACPSKVLFQYLFLLELLMSNDFLVHPLTFGPFLVLSGVLTLLFHSGRPSCVE